MKNKNQGGFTLIELLVAITIFAIIAGITVRTAASVQRAARDAQRQSDISIIKAALQQYYADQGYYPSSQAGFGAERTMSLDSMDEGLNSCVGRPGACDLATRKVYLKPIPQEPRLLNVDVNGFGSNHYCYEAWRDHTMGNHCNNAPGNRCHYFRISATLEIPGLPTFTCVEPSDPHPNQNFFIES